MKANGDAVIVATCNLSLFFGVFGCAVYNLNLERIPSSFRTDKAWLDLVDELGADRILLIKYTLAHIFAKDKPCSVLLYSLDPTLLKDLIVTARIQ